MIDRVDVLTGGASSVYGADAVAGVVNFIMDTDFEGVRLDTQYSFYQHENNTNEFVEEALNPRDFGFPTGQRRRRRHVGHRPRHRRRLRRRPRPHHRLCRLPQHQPGAAGQARLQRLRLTARTAAQVAGQSRPAPTIAAARRPRPTPRSSCSIRRRLTNFATFFQVGPNRTLIPGFTPYNFAPTNYFQRPDERYTAGLFAEYEISQARASRTWSSCSWTTARSRRSRRRATSATRSTINCDNPLLSAQQRAIICDTENLRRAEPARHRGRRQSGDRRRRLFTDRRPARPSTAASPRSCGATSKAAGAGTTCSTPNTASSPACAAISATSGPTTPTTSTAGPTSPRPISNDFSVTRLGRALDVIDNPNRLRRASTGDLPVAQADGTDPNCVPWDIFGTGTVGHRRRSTISRRPASSAAWSSETVANASLTGNLGE